MLCPTCQLPSAPLHYSHKETDEPNRHILVCPNLHFFSAPPQADLRTLRADQLAPNDYLTGKATVVREVFPNFKTETHVRGDLLTFEQHVEKHFCPPPVAPPPQPVEPGMQGFA